MQSCVCKRLLLRSLRKRISGVGFYHANEHSDAARKAPTTLQHRFIKYLEESTGSNRVARNFAENSILGTNSLIYSNNERLTERRLITTLNDTGDGLSLVLDDIENLKNVNDPRERKMRLDTIDEKICRALNTLSFVQILSLLNKLLEIVPQKLAGLYFYPKSTRRLREFLARGSYTSDKIVNFMFLVSLKKKVAATDVSFVLKYLPDMQELTLIEKCIVSVATYKAGIKLSRKNIQTIEYTVLANRDLMITDSPLFVALLKALRFGGPSTEFSLDLISSRIVEAKDRYRIPAAVPILALYAEMLKPQRKAIQRLVDDSIFDMTTSRISSESEEQRESFVPVRFKDVDRLLWAVSRLNHRMTVEQLEEIERFVDTNLETVLHKPKIIAGTLLSLWMLRSPKCRENVEYCFREKILEPLLNAADEDQEKLDLLLECVRIEAPGIAIPSVFTKERKEKSIKTCIELETVSELIKCLVSHLALYDTRIDCPAKMIRLYGISTRHQSLGWIHIDILNKVTCLKDTRQPNGLMSLKLRMIKRLGYFSILLYGDEATQIESMIAKIEERINSKLKKSG